MKRVIIVFVCIIWCITAKAQEIPIPEFDGQIAVVNTDSTITLLQKEAPTSKTKIGAASFIPVVGGFVGKTKVELVFQGTQSANVIPADSVNFIYRTKDNSTDPIDLLKIVKLDVKKKTREYTLAKANIVSSSSDNKSEINWTAKKYGQNCYIIIINELSDGQYAIIMTEDEAKVPTFGIQSSISE